MRTTTPVYREIHGGFFSCHLYTSRITNGRGVAEEEESSAVGVGDIIAIAIVAARLSVMSTFFLFLDLIDFYCYFNFKTCYIIWHALCPFYRGVLYISKQQKSCLSLLSAL